MDFARGAAVEGSIALRRVLAKDLSVIADGGFDLVVGGFFEHCDVLVDDEECVWAV